MYSYNNNKIVIEKLQLGVVVACFGENQFQKTHLYLNNYPHPGYSPSNRIVWKTVRKLRMVKNCNLYGNSVLVKYYKVYYFYFIWLIINYFSSQMYPQIVRLIF